MQLDFNIPPFVENGDGRARICWEAWKEQFMAYLALKSVEDHDEKYKALMCFGGPDVRKIAQTAKFEGSYVIDNPFRAAMDVLDDYYSPRMSLRYERFRFRQIKFNPHEKLDHFIVRVRSQAALCDFGDQLDEMIMDQIVFATEADDKLRAKYLECDRTLEDMMKIGRTHESVKAQVQELRNKGVFDSADVCELTRRKNKCNRCSGNHLGNDPKCPARSELCRLCGKIGHFARCCKSNRRNSQNIISKPHNPSEIKNENMQKARKQKFIREIEDTTEKVEIHDLFHINGKRSVMVDVGGVLIKFVVDTGADEDVLSMADWKTMKRIGFRSFGVRKGSNKIFQAYGSNKPLVVLGEIEAEIKYGNSNCDTTLYVIQNGKCSLLSGKTSEALGIVKFLHQIPKTPYPSIKDMYASIKINKSIPPVKQTLRRIPIPLEELTLFKLKELQNQDIIERVNEASEWVSPMLIKRKSANEVEKKIGNNKNFLYY
ncbi:uncharacterized protein LOC131437764 [Malaya genurostris]|uniref:uncharacterized protein LOC131437764 n=1 Tax=Malaya genurostris TaxID=325434 RepID=UPI0026F38484|nr:uncharacterized protein LOC131437764 [Malaya genurostris]